MYNESEVFVEGIDCAVSQDRAAALVLGACCVPSALCMPPCHASLQTTPLAAARKASAQMHRRGLCYDCSLFTVQTTLLAQKCNNYGKQRLLIFSYCHPSKYKYQISVSLDCVGL